MLPLWLLVILFVGHISNLLAWYMAWIDLQKAAMNGFLMVTFVYLFRIGQELFTMI